MRYLWLIVLLFSCGKKSAEPPRVVNSQVVEIANTYKELHHGWAHDFPGERCDSLGFTALCKISGGCKDANIFDAESKTQPGRWFRHYRHDCYDRGESKSDISKDMLLMLFAYLHHTGDRAALRRIASYGESRGWIMGRGLLSRTLMTPTQVALLKALIDGSKVEEIRSEKAIMDFTWHLDAIYWWLKADLNGGMSPIDYEKLRRYVEKEPRNALFQALYRKYRDGNQEIATQILLDGNLFPRDRLPTKKDRCEAYLWQRDSSSDDWKPCDREEVHDGVDFIFAAFIAGQI